MTTTSPGVWLPLPLEVLLTQLKRAAHFLGQGGITPASIVCAHANILVCLGWRRPANRLFELAIYLLDRSRSRRSFRVRQRWQFEAERNLARLGEARVHDPLFDVHIAPVAEPSPPVARSKAPGYYSAQITHRGLRIDGYLRPGSEGKAVEVLVDGTPVRRCKATRILPGVRIFVIRLLRDALAQMPVSAVITVRVAEGQPLLNEGCVSTLVRIPHARGSADISVDKKGFLVRKDSSLATRHQSFLKTYSAARKFFEEELGTPLFVLYGTLLGAHRGGDFIPGDDDFDVGYWSDLTRSDDVRNEGTDFLVRLVQSGFVVAVNRAGRLFRLRLPGMPPECHLDVHAIWKERGHVWIHPYAALNLRREDFLPCGTGRLGAAEVAVPAHPERFLSAYYGKNWRVPDPSYSTTARRFERWKSRHLERSCLRPIDVQRIRERVDAEPRSGEGQFIAAGLHPLYPLDRFEAVCDW